MSRRCRPKHEFMTMRRRANTTSCKTMSCQHSAVPTRRCNNNGVVSTQRCATATSCQDDELSTRCRVKTVSCQDTDVLETTPIPDCVLSKRCRTNTSSFQYDALSRRRRVNTTPCQKQMSYNNDIVTWRMRVNTTSFQHDAVSKWFVPTRCRVKMT